MNNISTRRIELVKNKNKTLMIHSFKSLLNLIPHDGISKLTLEDIVDSTDIQKIKLKEEIEKSLEEYLITFDDGLYQQIELIKLFNPEKVIFFPSFGLLRPPEMEPIPIENSYAHKHKNTSLSTFMTSTEVWNLVHTGYKLGMHGWYHLNLNLNHPDINTGGKSPLRIIKDDAKKCAKEYSVLIKKHLKILVKDNFPNELNLYYCTPYNIMNDYQKLYIQIVSTFLAQFLEDIIPQKLTIFSYERIAIENFIKELTCHYVKD